MKYGKEAFTLIEITIAMLILTVGLVGILTLFPVGFDAASRAGHVTTATFLAQREIENAKRIGYDGVADITKQAFAAAPYQNFDYQLTTQDGIDGLELKKVEVTVFWPAGSANQRSIVLTTYIANYGP